MVKVGQNSRTRETIRHLTLTATVSIIKIQTLSWIANSELQNFNDCYVL